MAFNGNGINHVGDLVGSLNGGNVKYIRKERGLIERSENQGEKVILAEDNRQVIFG